MKKILVLLISVLSFAFAYAQIDFNDGSLETGFNSKLVIQKERYIGSKAYYVQARIIESNYTASKIDTSCIIAMQYLDGARYFKVDSVYNIANKTADLNISLAGSSQADVIFLDKRSVTIFRPTNNNLIRYVEGEGEALRVRKLNANIQRVDSVATELQLNGGGGSVTVVDDLTSTSGVLPLSANQGRVLDQKKLDIASENRDTITDFLVSNDTLYIQDGGIERFAVLPQSVQSIDTLTKFEISNDTLFINDGGVDNFVLLDDYLPSVDTLTRFEISNDTLFASDGGMTNFVLIPKETKIDSLDRDQSNLESGHYFLKLQDGVQDIIEVTLAQEENGVWEFSDPNQQLEENDTIRILSPIGTTFTDPEDGVQKNLNVRMTNGYLKVISSDGKDYRLPSFTGLIVFQDSLFTNDAKDTLIYQSTTGRLDTVELGKGGSDVFAQFSGSIKSGNFEEPTQIDSFGFVSLRLEGKATDDFAFYSFQGNTPINTGQYVKIKVRKNLNATSTGNLRVGDAVNGYCDFIFSPATGDTSTIVINNVGSNYTRPQLVERNITDNTIEFIVFYDANAVSTSWSFIADHTVLPDLVTPDVSAVGYVDLVEPIDFNYNYVPIEVSSNAVNNIAGDYTFNLPASIPKDTKLSFYIDSITTANQATLTVDAGLKLAGTLDGVFYFTNYSANTQFEATRTSDGWAISVAGGNTELEKQPIAYIEGAILDNNPTDADLDFEPLLLNTLVAETGTGWGVDPANNILPSGWSIDGDGALLAPAGTWTIDYYLDHPEEDASGTTTIQENVGNGTARIILGEFIDFTGELAQEITEGWAVDGGVRRQMGIRKTVTFVEPTQIHFGTRTAVNGLTNESYALRISIYDATPSEVILAGMAQNEDIEAVLLYESTVGSATTSDNLTNGLTWGQIVSEYYEVRIVGYNSSDFSNMGGSATFLSTDLNNTSEFGFHVTNSTSGDRRIYFTSIDLSDGQFNKVATNNTLSFRIYGIPKRKQSVLENTLEVSSTSYGTVFLDGGSGTVTVCPFDAVSSESNGLILNGSGFSVQSAGTYHLTPHASLSGITQDVQLKVNGVVQYTYSDDGNNTKGSGVTVNLTTSDIITLETDVAAVWANENTGTLGEDANASRIIVVPIAQNNVTLSRDDAIIEGWNNFTPTIQATVTNPTEGTNVKKGRYRYIGQSFSGGKGTLDMTVSYRQTAAGTAGSGVYYFALPSGYTVDPAFIDTFNASGDDMISWGVATLVTDSVSDNHISGEIHLRSEGVMILVDDDGNAIQRQFVDDNWYMLSDAQQEYKFNCSIPVIKQ